MGYILWLNVATQMTENHCSIQRLGICKKSLEVCSQSCPTVLPHIAYHHNYSRWREVYASFLHFKSQKHWQDINFFWSFDSNVYLLLDLYLYYPNSSGYYGQPEKKLIASNPVFSINICTMGWTPKDLIKSERPQRVMNTITGLGQ